MRGSDAVEAGPHCLLLFFLSATLSFLRQCISENVSQALRVGVNFEGLNFCGTFREAEMRKEET